MTIRDIFETKWFGVIVSLVWGFGLALLFKKTCPDTGCVVVKVPPTFYKANQIIYDKNGTCYKLERYNSTCAY